MEFDESRRHHREISHHWRMLQKAVKGSHHLDDGDIRTIVDKLMVRLSGIGPAPCIGEGVELRLAHRAARFAEENVVIRVRVKWRIEINKIDTRIRELAPVAQPLQIVAEIQPIHPLFLPAVWIWMQ